jgi:hypothetical protein
MNWFFKSDRLSKAYKLAVLETWQEERQHILEQ